MAFNDLIFIYAFLPLTMLITYMGKSNTYRNIILVLSSILFITWARPFWVAILFSYVILVYLLGFIIDTKESKALSVAALVVTFLCSAGVLGLLLYVTEREGWTAETMGLTLIVKNVLVPIGIALYVLRGVGYCLEVFRGEIDSEKNPINLFVYMGSYHLIFVGPYVKYDEISPEIIARRVDARSVSDGITRFIYGLGKSVIFPSTLLELSALGLDTTYPSFYGTIFGVMFLMMGIYFALSGYSDMAIGLGKMNGLDYGENFSRGTNNPNVTSCVKNYNKSITNYFSEFLIIPAAKKGRIFTIIAMLVSSAMIGFLYGMKTNFVIFGLYFGVICVIESLFLNRLLQKLPKIIVWLYSALACLGGWGIFAFGTVKEAKIFVKSLLFMGENPEFIYRDLFNGIANNIYVLIIALFLFLPTKYILSDLSTKLTEKNAILYNAIKIGRIALNVAILAVSTVLIADVV